MAVNMETLRGGKEPSFNIPEPERKAMRSALIGLIFGGILGAFIGAAYIGATLGAGIAGSKTCHKLRFKGRRSP